MKRKVPLARDTLPMSTCSVFIQQRFAGLMRRMLYRFLRQRERKQWPFRRIPLGLILSRGLSLDGGNVPFGGPVKSRWDFRKCLKLKINMLMKSTGQSPVSFAVSKKAGHSAGSVRMIKKMWTGQALWVGPQVAKVSVLARESVAFAQGRITVRQICCRARGRGWCHNATGSIWRNATARQSRRPAPH